MDADLEWSDDELYATPLPGMDVLLPDIDTMHADKKQDTDHRKERNSLSSDEPNELEKQSELERPAESPTRPDKLIDIPTQSDNESSMSDDNIPLHQIQKQLERRSEMPSKTDRLIEIPTQSENESSMSDDNIPLRQIQKHLQKKRKRQVTQLSSESSEFDDSDNDKNYLPSDDKYSSDERCKTPLIEKRKSKWMRKRIRPLKREEGRKQAKKLVSHDKDSKKIGKQYTYSNDCIQKPRTFSKRSKIVQSTSNQTISSQEKQAEESGVELQTALKKSMAVHNANSILKTFAESRLSNLLTCNGLERIHIRPDGNCYFNAVLSQITSTFTPFEFRSELCKHLLDKEEHYKGYMANRATDELETSHDYVEKVNHLKSEGIWNVELSDILPLCIGDKLIRCTLQKKQHGGYSGTDQRGKHAPANKTDIVTIAHVKKHIESFPVVDSHYKRKTTQRKFLEQDLTIRKMHDLYKIKCQEDNIPPVSETVYRNTFCNDYNLSFHRPKKDACQTCNTYEEKKRTGLLTPDDEATHNAHIERKEKSRREKESDKQRSKSNKSVYAATFDLEAVLSTPCSNVSQVYYKRKLNTYNLTFYSLADRKGTCYVWDETHGQRGSSEIGTCVITHINSLPSTVNHVILYSDCCSGQNRNQFLASGLLHTVSKHPYIKVIEQKFLESGHTQMECDSMHAAIEHAKKRTSIFSPDQWDTIFQMARRNNPYTVVPMRFDSFYDLKEYTKTNYKNFKIDTEGIKVNWLKVKVLKVSKETPDQILVKYDFDQTEFRSINVAKASRGRPSPNRDLRRKYKEKIPISMAKKRDLLDLCRSFIIPQQYWKFYELLPTNDKVKDRLTCPDILEEESDTDNE